MCGVGKPCARRIPPPANLTRRVSPVRRAKSIRDAQKSPELGGSDILPRPTQGVLLASGSQISLGRCRFAARLLAGGTRSAATYSERSRDRPGAPISGMSRPSSSTSLLTRIGTIRLLNLNHTKAIRKPNTINTPASSNCAPNCEASP